MQSSRNRVKIDKAHINPNHRIWVICDTNKLDNLPGIYFFDYSYFLGNNYFAS